MAVITVNPTYDAVAGSSSFELPASTPVDAVLLLFYNGQVLKRSDFTRVDQTITINADVSQSAIEVLILEANSGNLEGDFVTKDAMRTFSSYMMLGIQSAFGIQCTEADALLQAQQQSNDLQRQLAALKDSAVQRDIENTPEYQNLLAQNAALLTSIDDLRSRTMTTTPESGSTLQTPDSPNGSTDENGLYIPRFWDGVIERMREVS